MDKKRLDYISWDKYFMSIAILTSHRSKDPNTQVGACIVNSDNKIIGIGYNGFPKGCDDDHFPWSKTATNELENKYLYVCHAELNAILNCNQQVCKGCKLYVTLFPCNECTKVIIQTGISEIIYIDDKYSGENSTIASKKMLDFVKINYSKYVSDNKSIIL